MRYAGQGFEVHVDLPDGPIDDGYPSAVVAAFQETYLRKHRFCDEQAAVESVDWTLVATLPHERHRVQLETVVEPNGQLRPLAWPSTICVLA